MAKVIAENPFHDGELEAQSLAGMHDVAEWAGGFIRNHLPEQHREFHTSLPFLVIAGADNKGRTWVTIIDGEDGFIQSPNKYSILLDTQIDEQDPLKANFHDGIDIGVIGIELASRRRNRFSGYVQKVDDGYAIKIRQTFGNCPQYINERAWMRVEGNSPAQAKNSSVLSQSQRSIIEQADTMFIGSGNIGPQQQSADDSPSRGYDASHRGGAAGFVKVMSAKQLQIPDYAGNNFFNTIGNLLVDSRIGLVFVDFETGSLLHISGRATIDWNPKDSHDSNALRMINVDIESIVERPKAVSLRWTKQDYLSRQYIITRREKEANDITSFYLTPSDDRELRPFEAGQHLPIEVQIPGQIGMSKRSYSLSGSANQKDYYRLSIKREYSGLVSNFFHDEIYEGAIIQASNPSGDFIIPCSQCPLVLVSAGVGITPLLSMLHAVLSEATPRPIWFVHGTRNGTEHAFRQEVEALMVHYPNAKSLIFYSQPNDEDVAAIDYDREGRITAKDLYELNAGSDAHYMLCGPSRFLTDIKFGLEASGVVADNIHFETFGPTG